MIQRRIDKQCYFDILVFLKFIGDQDSFSVINEMLLYTLSVRLSLNWQAISIQVNTTAKLY